MDAYLLNTETRQRFTLRYIEPRFTTGSYSSVYQAANVPYSTKNQTFWTGTQTSQKSLTCYLDGNIKTDIDTIKSFCVPAKNKKSPPIVQFKLASLPITNIVITNVTVEYDLNYFDKTKGLTRATLTIQYMEYDE